MRTQRYIHAARSIALAMGLVVIPVLFESASVLAAPVVYTVDSTGDGGNTGSATTCNDGTGHCTLRAALEAANANAGADSISFSLDSASDPNCDPAIGPCTIRLTRALPDISDSLEIHGPGADLLAIRRVAGNFIRIFNVTATGVVSFSGLSFIHAVLDPGDGAGIRNQGTGTVIVSHCVFSRNEATSGGALANGPGTMLVTDSTISDNTVTFTNGAGGILNNGGTVTVARCIISHNRGDSGGAIRNVAGTVNILDSTISDNLGVARGGGISNLGTLNVTNSTIDDNDGDSGGGLSNSGTAILTHCTIVGNSGVPGGGIDNGGALYITNSTITGNDSSIGGGVNNRITGTATVKSTIIALNRGFSEAPDVLGAFDSAGFNFIGSRGDFHDPTDIVGATNALIDPMLDPKGLQDNGGPTRTIGLLCDSPAIDRGNRIGLSGPLVGDQRGFPRTFDDPSISDAAGGDGTDIGAFELGVACSDCDLTCSADIDQDNTWDQCGAVVDIPAPTLTSSACPYSCSLSSGTFAVGTFSATCKTGTKECSFDVTVHDTQKPTVTTPPSVTVPNDPGSCSATVDPGTATVNDNCPGVAVHGVRSDGQPLNAAYPVGTTTITWTATDASTNTSVPPALQTITVVDTEPPKLDNVTISPSALWPPNHTMRDVTVDYTATDNCPAACTLFVVSSEPDNGLGDGDTAPDWLVKDAHHEQLRAERSGLGDGRTYTTTVTCSDGAGHSTSKSADVNVSHDMDRPARGSLFPAGAMVSFAGHFGDSPRIAHTGEWIFDSLRKPATVIAADLSNPWGVNTSTSFNTFGVYRVQMNVTDSSGRTGSTSMVGGLDANIVIYPSSGEYVAGAGWIDSPAGAYVANRSVAGKGSFGFVSRSAHTAKKAIAGETEFDLHLPGFRFNALNFESQTVNGAKAQFRGTGTVNGAGSYGFVLTTTDGGQIGGAPDTFRIRIWSKATGATVYDNEMGSPDNADPVTPVGSGSSIVITR